MLGSTVSTEAKVESSNAALNSGQKINQVPTLKQHHTTSTATARPPSAPSVSPPLAANKKKQPQHISKSPDPPMMIRVSSATATSGGSTSSTSGTTTTAASSTLASEPNPARLKATTSISSSSSLPSPIPSPSIPPLKSESIPTEFKVVEEPSSPQIGAPLPPGSTATLNRTSKKFKVSVPTTSTVMVGKPPLFGISATAAIQAASPPISTGLTEHRPIHSSNGIVAPNDRMGLGAVVTSRAKSPQLISKVLCYW
ncbi:unnamed protein product [Protopolystoma xenopodis]|uniref:Uncharacterized protein n=1 Tax=Protopolystoma xenopodis TaxID=117903 RepID=A0A448X8L5_9PLAT|nr:unnamed protein product [Protopolystoma xenopodis]